MYIYMACGVAMIIWTSPQKGWRKDEIFLNVLSFVSRDRMNQIALPTTFFEKLSRHTFRDLQDNFWVMPSFWYSCDLRLSLRSNLKLNGLIISKNGTVENAYLAFINISDRPANLLWNSLFLPPIALFFGLLSLLGILMDVPIEKGGWSHRWWESPPPQTPSHLHNIPGSYRCTPAEAEYLTSRSG